MTPEWEAALQKLDRYTDRLPYRFERVMIGKLNAIRLVGDGMGSNIPLRRTLWSLTFPDQYARDRFYCWLCHHIDRWGDWGTRAWQNGPRALSEYLLQLKFADERAVTPDRPSSIMPRTTGGLFEGRPLSFIRGQNCQRVICLWFMRSNSSLTLSCIMSRIHRRPYVYTVANHLTTSMKV